MTERAQALKAGKAWVQVVVWYPKATDPEAPHVDKAEYAGTTSPEKAREIFTAASTS